MRVGGRLRARLAVRAGLLALATLAAVGAVLEFAVVRPLEGEVDADLRARVDGLATVVAEGGRAGFHRVVEGALGGARDGFLALLGADGVPIESAGPAVPPGVEGLPPDRPGTLRDPVAGEVRVLRREAVAPGGERLVVAAGVSMADSRQRQGEIRFLLVVAALAGAALVAGGAAAGAGLVLDPLRDLTEAARRADAGGDLRLPGSGRGDEFGDLALLLNDLLARVRAAMEEERRFAGEAAHELRSPMAVLRLRAEAALAKGDAESIREALRSSQAEVDRVERLVRALLELSRAGPAPSVPGSADAAAVIGALAEDLATLAEARGLTLSWRPPAGPVPVAAPREIVETVVSVLVDNALRYTPAGGTVAVEVVPGGDRVRVRVSDSGPGVPAAEGERVFERLFRGGAGRASGAGFGLGLALARRLARSAGGDVVLENPGEPGARFAALLPPS